MEPAADGFPLTLGDANSATGSRRRTALKRLDDSTSYVGNRYAALT